MSLYSLRRHIEWRGSLRAHLGGLAGCLLRSTCSCTPTRAVSASGFGIFLAAYAAYMLLASLPATSEEPGGSALRLPRRTGGGLVGGLTAMRGGRRSDDLGDLRGLEDRQRGVVQP